MKHISLIGLVFFITGASNAFAVTTAQLQKVCTDWQAKFGTDKTITISTTDLLDRPATATWSVLPYSNGCITNLDETIFSIYRTHPFFNNEPLIYTLGLKKKADETWEVSRMFSENCIELVYAANIAYLQSTHVIVQPEFEHKVYKKSKEESCPLQLEAAKNKILEVLNQ